MKYIIIYPINANHGAGIPTKLGDFGQGQMLVNIAYMEHMGMGIPWHGNPIAYREEQNRCGCKGKMVGRSWET
jgi:hypothetical protein